MFLSSIFFSMKIILIVFLIVLSKIDPCDTVGVHFQMS
jgi:hypothetical protein